MTRYLIFLSLSCAAAVAQISPPRIGAVQPGDGSVRPLYGVSGNLLLGDPLASNVLSAASSPVAILAKTDSTLFVFSAGGETIFSGDADSGPALFAFSTAGQPALAYIPSSGTLLRWRADRFDSVPLDASSFNGDPIAIAMPDHGHAAFVIQHDDGLWTLVASLETGEIESQSVVPGAAGPALLAADGALLYKDTQGLILQRTDGSLQRFDVPALASLDVMSAEWVHATSADQATHFALRLTPGREAVYQIPEAQQ